MLATCLGSTLMGQTPREEKEAVIAQFACGDIKILFGTHALLQDDVVAHDCSLVCIDEQQRFGVEQRQTLIAKAPGADILSMTATPIPRSLALARYGGLSLSYLHRPPAKQGGAHHEGLPLLRGGDRRTMPCVLLFLVASRHMLFVL